MKSPLIFIDANIYLDCYQRRYPNYRKLLNSLELLVLNILYTRSVDYEVMRNRVLAYIKNSNIDIPKFAYPDPYQHYFRSNETDDDSPQTIKQSRLKIKTEIQSMEAAAKGLHTSNIQSILNGEDDVSKLITSLRAHTQVPTQSQIDRARFRKEIGNPPGKKSDPLGDQISWEQLLDAAKGVNDVWIVSNDRDYLVRVEGQVLPQPSPE